MSKLLNLSCFHFLIRRIGTIGVHLPKLLKRVHTYEELREVAGRVSRVDSGTAMILMLGEHSKQAALWGLKGMEEITGKMEELKHHLPTKSSMDGLSWEQGAEERAQPTLQGSFLGPLPHSPSPDGLKELLAWAAIPLLAAASVVHLRLLGLLCLWGPALLRGLCKPRGDP